MGARISPELAQANAPTYSEVQVEDAVQDVLDHIIATTERLVPIGYDNGEITPLDIASRVLAHLRKDA